MNEIALVLFQDENSQFPGNQRSDLLGWPHYDHEECMQLSSIDRSGSW